MMRSQELHEAGWRLVVVGSDVAMPPKPVPG